MKQLALELASPPAPTLDNFVVGSNAEVMATLRALSRGDNHERFIYLWGGNGSGRTHLLRAVLDALVQAGRTVRILGATDSLDTVAASDVVGVDDVQSLVAPAQIELFSIFNKLKDGSGMLVVTGNMPPARLQLREDLLTRLAWGLVYEVHALSEADRLAALVDYAAARGFELPRPVADYLLAHAPRDLHSLRALVDGLDRLSLERKRDITVPLARELLQPAPQGN